MKINKYSLMLYLLCLLIIWRVQIPKSVCAAYTVNSGNCGTNAKYTLDSDGVLTITGSGAAGSWEVGTITSSYFAGLISNVKKVVVKSGITVITKNSFYQLSNIESVSLPDTLREIEDYAFAGCTSLKSITIPNSVNKLGASAFSLCTNLTKVVLSNNITDLKQLTFNNCTNLSIVKFPTNLKTIGEYCFKSCYSLLDFTIPPKVQEIDQYAFFYCKMRSINIPASVTRLRDDFSNCLSLKEIHYGGSYYQWRELINSSSKYSGFKITYDITLPQTINIVTSSIEKYYTSNLKITLNASAKTSLTYKSSNKKVATVSQKGVITAKGYGKATITVKASKNDIYSSATKSVKVILKPAKPTVTNVVGGPGKFYIAWNKDKKVSGYQIEYKLTSASSYKKISTETIDVDHVTVPVPAKGQYNIRFCTFIYIGKKVYTSQKVSNTITVY